MQAGLLAIIKDSVSLSSGVLPYNFMQVTPGSSSITSWELGLREPAKYDDTLATAITVSNSPCFSPGVLCLQPASMKLWHAHLLACKDYTLSDPSQFLTLLYKAPHRGIQMKEFFPFKKLKICRSTAVTLALEGTCFKHHSLPPLQ